MPQRRDHIAVQAGILALGGDHRIDIRRGAPDIDDEDITADNLGENLDALQHRVRGGCPYQLGKAAPPRQPLAADHVGEEGLTDRTPGTIGSDLADPGGPHWP